MGLFFLPPMARDESGPFSKFVEIGRVAYVNYGPETGKLCVILDVIDSNRAWVDGPGLSRQQINFRRLTLTKFIVKILRGARAKNVKKAWEEANIESQWKETAWAKRLSEQKRRANLNDFERFQVMINRKKRSATTRKNLKQLKAQK